jgi:hypothetical protein
MKKLELYNLHAFIIESINKGEKVGREFSFALVMNETILKPIIDAFNKEKKPANEGLRKYVEEYNNLITKFSEEGEVKDGQKAVIKNYSAYMQALTALNTSEEFAPIVAENNRNEAEFLDFLNTDYSSEVNLYKISVKDLPEQIEPKIVYLLKDIIKPNN